MQLEFSADWAVRVLLYLAATGKLTPSSELSARLGINKNSLLTIGRKMKKSGLVHVEQGPFGGYILARRPEEITVHDILTAFDSNLKFSALEGLPYEAALAADGFYTEIEDNVTQMLKSKTLADLLREWSSDVSVSIKEAREA